MSKQWLHIVLHVGGRIIAWGRFAASKLGRLAVFEEAVYMTHRRALVIMFCSRHQ